MTEALLLHEADVDRVRELASIGAGHAANALASLTGRTCEMRVPTVRLLSAQRVEAAAEGPDERDMTGVFFEVEGGLGGVLALLLPAASCERLLAHLLGGAGHDRSDPASQSALREVGNILASHAANAVGEMLGVTMLPSIPRLALEDATGALARLLARRAPHPPELRVETEICDRARELCGILVFAPDRLQEPGTVRARHGFPYRGGELS
jgi:chemotaxis protein CheC